jgi:hypothetical protein
MTFKFIRHSSTLQKALTKISRTINLIDWYIIVSESMINIFQKYHALSIII